MGTRTAGFHDGELLVQRRAGVESEAAGLVGMVTAPRLGPRVDRFLTDVEFAVLTARDPDGRLWTVALSAVPGFLRVEQATLILAASPDPDGPLGCLPVGQDVGLIAIEFATRRRLRLNGRLSVVGPQGLRIEVEQAFGNCPAYIQSRTLARAAPGPPAPDPAGQGRGLTAAQLDLVARADTFFLGTQHPDAGADTSHKGGRPGFVRVEGDRLWWPDYAGNNMFNSLGNITADGAVALLFLDFARPAALHVSGRAEIEWVAPGSPGDDGGTGRRIVLHVERVAEHAIALGASAPQFAEALPELA